MIRSFLTFFIICLFTGTMPAQESVVRERTGGEMILFETHYILADTDSHTVVVPYRVRNDFFVFTRSKTSPAEIYTASADAVAEILDSAGNSITRKIESIELTAATNSTSELHKNYTQGLMTFRLPVGKYNVLFRIEDKESKRTSPDITKSLIIPSSQNSLHSTLIPVSEQNNGSHEFALFNLGGDVLFSKDFGFLVVSEKNNIQTVRYSIAHTFGEENSERNKILDTAVQCIPFHAAAIDFSQKNSDIIATIAQDKKQEIYFIPVNGSQLRQGRYEISIMFNDSVTTKTIFATRWLDMPMSLNDLDIATYPLQYLLTEDDYSTLRRGTRETRIEKFEEFWKKKDPTPATAMNEMMAEFYRRVDYTISAFRTLKEPNGSLTDRGRIYILFGKPTSTERSLYPNSTPKEVWKYQNLKKTFVFEDQSKQGNYKLAESK